MLHCPTVLALQAKPPVPTMGQGYQDLSFGTRKGRRLPSTAGGNSFPQHSAPRLVLTWTWPGLELGVLGGWDRGHAETSLQPKPNPNRRAEHQPSS